LSLEFSSPPFKIEICHLFFIFIEKFSFSKCLSFSFFACKQWNQAETKYVCEFRFYLPLKFKHRETFSRSSICCSIKVEWKLWVLRFFCAPLNAGPIQYNFEELYLLYHWQIYYLLSMWIIQFWDTVKYQNNFKRDLTILLCQTGLTKRRRRVR
jgi:hypothetical protein